MDNPYQSNSAVSYSPKEVRFYRAVLQHYKKYQGRDMPLLDIVWMYGKSWLLTGILLLLLFLLFMYFIGRESPLVAVGVIQFLLGMFFGRLGRDIYHCRASTRFWPIVREVLNWESVDRKLEELGPK